MRAGAGLTRTVTRGVRPCGSGGHHVAVRLLAAGEQVIDVPPKLSARARDFAAGQGRKTDATDAHSVALVGTRMAGAARFGNASAITPTRVHTTGSEHAEGCSGQSGYPADEDWGADADRVGDRPEDWSADRCGADKENGL